jgi:adenosylcobinamide kinase / adenosylcobinamide-phosphate guanylyltransferase
VAFVATAEPGDAEMAARIARHRAERPRHWRTVEAPVDLVDRVTRLAAEVDAALVDCLTLWVSNRLLRGDVDQAVLDETDRLAALIDARRVQLTLVSNEVGEGIHPSTAAGLRFRDLLGLVNQKIAAVSDRVVLMVAGIPVTLKSGRVPVDTTLQTP